MKIVLMEPLAISKEDLSKFEDRLIQAGHSFMAYDSKTTQVDELISRACDADAIIIANNPLPGAAIDGMKNLKFISVAFVGIDHVDLETCQQRNIEIANAAGYCTDAVAELAIGLTLSVLRNIPRCDQATRAYQSKHGLVGFEMSGKTFGILGTGAIGIKTALIAKAIGCKVIAYSRTKKISLMDLGIEYVSFEDLLKESDILSLHTPLTPETKGLIGEKELNLMKPSALLINTARGPIVDSMALYTALNNKTIAGAGLDVFDIEPPLNDKALVLSLDHCVFTPHVAYATKESMVRRADFVFENILEWTQGRSIRKMT